mmetsp:Transcript_20793/g.36682  ORF Transcript_20793/g.36682 Transcript_20793/m.36682 type:complete len:455 (-) Transcript_20793:293-1657(-)
MHVSSRHTSEIDLGAESSGLSAPSAPPAHLAPGAHGSAGCDPDAESNESSEAELVNLHREKSDEALARKLQAEEEARPKSDLWPGAPEHPASPVRAASHSAPVRAASHGDVSVGKASPTPNDHVQASPLAASRDFSDEDLARMLQRQEEEAQTPVLQGGAAVRTGGGEMTDEELARLLQEHEEEEDAEQAAPRPRPPRPPVREQRNLYQHLAQLPQLPQMPQLQLPRPEMPRVPQLSVLPPWGGASSCWPMLGSCLSSGAFVGCCSGMQAASMLGLGNAAMWLCTIGGVVSGHMASDDKFPFQGAMPPRFEPPHDDDSEFDSDDEEDHTYVRGLNHDAIEGHTVGHVFNAPPGPSAASASSGAGASSSSSGSGALSAEDRKCMVCMEMFEQGDNLRLLPCLHRYHQACIDEWLCRSAECPICKRNITDTTVSQAPVHAPDQRGRLRRRLFGGWS